MASPTSSDELQQLWAHVEKLRERLDFMAPMLSLLHFTQDFFQRVECEASVQLLRLKNANLTEEVSAGVSEEPNMVDTARWLHTMTDLVMSLQRCRHQSGSNTPAVSRESMGQSSPLQRSSLRMPATVSFCSESPPTDAIPTARPVVGKGGKCGQGSTASAASGTSASSGSSAAGAMSAGKELKARDAMRSVSLDNTLEFGGLALGRGTWANAYRQPKGDRRDALRLLCSTGIVTERELADDLTVISQEHVEECIAIAGEMLRRWPAERGPPPRAEAKTFFEERLAALYMRRAPAPFH